MRKIIFWVTPEDIEDGGRSHPNSCPIALALKRIYPYASVGTYGGTVGDGIMSNMYVVMDPETSHFITRFDNGEKVEPGYYSATVEDDER